MKLEPGRASKLMPGFVSGATVRTPDFLPVYRTLALLAIGLEGRKDPEARADTCGAI